MHASKPLIDIDAIRVSFGSDTVLNDISFCLHPGEFVGIIGPNGSGKTTLLRSLLGLQPVSSGSVKRSKNLTIGYVPQRGRLYDGSVPISVREIVALSGARPADAKHALATVGLERLADSRFTDLSGGQQQRVIIAKALAANSNLLVLDEPTTGVDENAQKEFYGILTKLQSQGITIVMVSHEIDTTVALVTRVICINRTILYDGSPEHFDADNYLSPTYKEQHVRLHHKGDYHA